MKQKNFKIGDKVKIINPDEKLFNMIGEIVDMKIHNDVFDWIDVRFNKVNNYTYTYYLNDVEKIKDEHNFEWAIKQMKQGKFCFTGNPGRKYFYSEHTGLFYYENNTGTHKLVLSFPLFNSTNWEIYNEKLKTINELKEFDPQPCCGELEVRLIRNEAIKWVKEMIRTYGKEPALLECKKLIEFMDIKEKDL